MSAPAKSTGGSKSQVKASASGRKTRGAARSAPTSSRLLAESDSNRTLADQEDSRGAAKSVPRNTKSDSAVPHNKRAEAIRSKTPEREGSTEPPRYSNRSARPRILEAARTTATEHGYERLRLQDITTEAGITHQAFYGHFANKRHAVAVATSDELGAVADLATRGSKRDEEWALRMLDDIDRTLAQQYPATDGPEKWLRDRICEAIATEGGYGSLRIIELIKVSTLGHGEFYRRYGGKRGCLQRIYGDALAEVRSEAESDPSIESLGRAIASDSDRANLLILGSPHLPDREQEEEGKATQSSLLEMLSEVVAAELGGNATDRHVLVITGGVLEVIRSAVISDRLADLTEELSVFELVGEGHSRAPAMRLVA